MARMYSRKKGKAGSKKPIKKVVKQWIRYKPNEVELLISKFAKEGKTSSQIGIYLRDTYGIPDVKTLTKKSITQILKEKNLIKTIPEDLMALIKKNIVIRKHLEANKKDESALRGLIITESKIKRLVKYFKRTRKLPEDWKFQPERLKLYLE
jgi:small subunit ribosomal protein S15